MNTFVCLLSLAASSAAVAIVPRSTTATSLPYNFTLAAVNTTLHNANTTGVPMVLGQAGATTGASFHVLSTFASYPYNDFPTLALVSSSVRAFTASGSWNTNASDLYSTPYRPAGSDSASNAELEFLTTSYYPPAVASSEYSAIQSDGDEFAQFAALGRADLWSLCPFWPDERLSQTNLVFNVTGEADPKTIGFTASDCWGVKVNIVPV